jgi:hypothetical protein
MDQETFNMSSISPFDVEVLDALNIAASRTEANGQAPGQTSILGDTITGLMTPENFIVQPMFADRAAAPFLMSLRSPIVMPLAAVEEQNQLEQFTCFEELLPELRDKIWSHALPVSQVIELYRNNSAVYNSHMSRDARKTLINLLTACPESYALVKRCYKLMNFDVSTARIAEYPTILVSPMVDVLYFTNADHVALNIATPRSIMQAAQFKTIAMPADVFLHFFRLQGYYRFKEWLSILVNLKTLNLVCIESHKAYGEEITFINGDGPFYGISAVMKKQWIELTKEMGRDIQLVWVWSFRNGVLDN